MQKLYQGSEQDAFGNQVGAQFERCQAAASESQPQFLLKLLCFPARLHLIKWEVESPVGMSVSAGGSWIVPNKQQNTKKFLQQAYLQ